MASTRLITESKGLATSLFNIRRSKHFLDELSAAMRGDIMSDAPQMDHTAAVAAALADTTSRALVFPDGGEVVTDIFHLPESSKVRDLIFGSCVIKQRADRTSGPEHFFRTKQASPGYGNFDRLRIVGGLFDQNDCYTGGHIFHAAYLGNATLEDVTVKHRTVRTLGVTVDPETDVLTCAGHGWANGARVSLAPLGTGTLPTGAGPSGTGYVVTAATTDTFKLLRSGSAVNFTDAGSGEIIAFDHGTWGMAIGGRNVNVVRHKILNGTGIFQDGLHFTHGDGLRAEGGYSESGDDAYACGYETDTVDITEHTLQNVEISNCRAKTMRTFAVKVYVNDPLRSVRGVYIDGLRGQSGILRNGGIHIFDNVGTDPRSEAPKISNINITNFDLTVGSPERTDPSYNILAFLEGVSDVRLQGTFRLNGYPMQEYSANRCTQVDIDIKVEQSEPLLTAGISAAQVEFTKRFRPVKNLALNQDATGIASGTPGTWPTGWDGLAEAANGITRSVVAPPRVGGRQPVAVRLDGTAAGTSTWAILPMGKTTLAAGEGEFRRLRIKAAILAGSAAGCTFKMRIAERNSGGTILQVTDVTVPYLSGQYADLEVSRTLTDASTAYVTGALEIAVADGQTVDLTLGVLDPVFE